MDPKVRNVPQIGINYHGTKKSLKGCANDALNIKDVLTGKIVLSPYTPNEPADKWVEYMGFKSGDIDVLIDYFPFEAPTRKRILQALKDLVDGAEPGDSLFLHCKANLGYLLWLHGTV